MLNFVERVVVEVLSLVTMVVIDAAAVALVPPRAPPSLTEGPIRQWVNLAGTGGIVDVRDVDGRRMENVVGIDGDE